ncbi:MAG TPA: hypothetical protein VN317_06690 [Candidatus Methanoperedens sp.]|nr:hypothetical protein [Candidatus Methanoperedens sp.]
MRGEDDADRPDPEQLAAALCRRLGGIVDPEQRARALGERLAAHEPELIAAVLAEIIEAADRGQPGADLLVKAMITPGLRVAWKERLAVQVLAHARRARRYDLAGMFLDLPPLDERLAPLPPPLPKALAKVPLGMRRSLARRNDIGLIERLLGDADPAVVANLLNNPRITEVEVIRMAARSPVREEVLLAIGRHPRWGVHRRVRLALVHNPGTPTGVALGLLHLLLEQELREVAADARLSEVVRSRAQSLAAGAG